MWIISRKLLSYYTECEHEEERVEEWGCQLDVPKVARAPNRREATRSTIAELVQWSEPRVVEATGHGEISLKRIN
jgi:hypothetical protein